MAVPKIVGIETEYGVALRGAPGAEPGRRVEPPDQRLRRAAPHRLGLRGRVARAATRAASPATARSRPRSRRISSTRCSPTARATTSTTRTRSTPRPSAPTRSRPRCSTRRGSGSSPARWTRPAGCCPPGQEIVVYKNNSDGKGNSYGCHENYLVDRNVPFAALVRNLIPWFVTRQVFTGAGKVGSENGADACDFQISQRSDFFEEEVGLETTLKRPIVNTRDEPHADPQKYRRLHVIVGDANLCEVATFLKVGTTAIVLAMIEDGFIDKDLSISGAGRRDAARCRTTPRCRPRSTARRSAAAPRSSCSGSSCGSPASTPTRPASRRAAARRSATLVLDRWESVLDRARVAIPSALDGQLDWVTKLELLPRLRRPRRPQLERPEARAARPSSTTTCAPGGRSTRSSCAAGRIERLLDEADVLAAMADPPEIDPRVFPRHLPRPLGRLGGGRELGQPGARRRDRPAAKDPDDGAHAW